MGTDLETTVDSLLKLRTITKFAGDHRRTNYFSRFSNLIRRATFPAASLPCNTRAQTIN